MSATNIQITIEQFKELLINLDKSDKTQLKCIIFKFGASWCRPCQEIKQICNQCFSTMPSNVKSYEIDIDNNMELYSALKSKRMINGVPTLLAYVNKDNREEKLWYVSDISISGTNFNNIKLFFQTINNY